jgi:hypothetical protein
MVLDEVGGTPGVRGRGEAAHPGERVEVAQPEVERLAAAHRQPGQGPRLAVSLDRVGFLDEWDQVGKQVILENGERRCGGEHVPLGPVVLLRAAVGHDDDHRRRLLVGVQVVEDDVGGAAARPLVLVAADAVEEVQDRILLVLGVARRGVDPHLALHAHGRRVVLDRLQLATVDAVALGVEARGRGGELLRLVVLLLVRLGPYRRGQARQRGTRRQGQDPYVHGSFLEE